MVERDVIADIILVDTWVIITTASVHEENIAGVDSMARRDGRKRVRWRLQYVVPTSG